MSSHVSGVVMKFSLKWLSQYIDLQKHKAEDIADLLTDAGVEVEQIEDKAKSFERIVTAQIDRLEKHPHADRLTLCQVSTGPGQPHTIVCGATNHKQGDKVVLALPKATLPTGLTIKPVQIKGQISAGMLCSQAELGLSKESEGILILPNEAPIGESFAQYMGLDDVLLDVNVTSNRCDCLSHFGLARELAVLLKSKLTFPTPKLQTTQNTKSLIDLTVQQKELCPRYAGMMICNVQVKQSPAWLIRHLESVGSSSINNIVDVTNFVMLEMGQPLHAFDTRFLQGGQIQVDLAKPDEVFITLDDTELKMDGTELMIRDSEKPIALAGIVGGKNSGIREDTTHVFIESAYFKPSQVRRTSRKFGIETEASYRFSRGIDPHKTFIALERACQLIQEAAGGQIQKDFHDFYPHPLTSPSISFKLQDIIDRLGYDIELSKCCDLLKHLGCEVHTELTPNENPSLTKLKVTPPTYRQDLSIKEDLIEEIARLNGYDKIPSGQPLTNPKPKPHAKKYLLEKQVGQLLRGQGYQQTVHLAFAHEEKQRDFLGNLAAMNASGLHVHEPPVSLDNPLSQELGVMRQSLVPNLLSTVTHNCHHNMLDGRIYEIGYAFLNKTDSKETNADFTEEWRLGVMAWGQPLSAWQKDHPPLVMQVKQHIANVLKALNIVSYQWKTADPAPEFLHPRQTGILFCEGKNVGCIGTLHPLILKKAKIPVDVACVELNLDRLLAHHPRTPKAKDFSRFPSVQRDISFLADQKIEVGQIIQAISKAGSPLLQSVVFFDMYQDPDNFKGKSLTFRLSYQKKDATLKEDEVQHIQAKILKALEQKFSIHLRE